MTIPRQCYCFYSSIVVTLYFFFLLSLLLYALPSPMLHNCRHDQREALLEFKHEFPVDESNPSSNYDASLSSWNKSSDCCFWKGIVCDAKSGEVISLNLSYVPLNNSLKPNSGLFKLQNLRNLTLKNCSLYGELPSSLGNFSRLTKLNLLNNKLVGQVPASIGNLTQLRYLDLSQNYFTGIIPTSFANLTKLYLFYIHNNFFESTLPPDMSRLHNLIYFGVGTNSFVGSFPTSLFMIPSLIYITLERNHFKGPIEFGNTSLSSKLEFIVLHGNQFDGLVPESISQYLNLKELDLGYNKFIGPIPKSMSQLVNLYYLDLSNNKFEGKVPGCFWRLNVLKLSYNSFSSFETPDETEIIAIGLDSNSFQGPFPHWICKLRSLALLDLSNNRFSGSIPQCLWKSTDSLVELVLSNNSFSGNLPNIFANATNLNAIDLSSNKLEGKLPRSLIHCRGMKFLNLKRNKIKDRFPFWLGSLPSLHVLLLGSNQFYGSLNHHHVSIGLQNLRVIDVSHNNFSGTFPSFYFSNWREMALLNTEYNDTYMKDSVHDAAFFHSMEMVHKGVDREFERIREDFRAIDFSRNRLYGNIPKSIGLLKELRILNLSGNAFTSSIPQSLANLTKLEQLDLSWNQLSGQIPRDLGSLSFLSTMDFSHNNLEGPVPRGTQFQSQNCSSFMDNPKLYGLEEICGETHVPNSTPKESEDFVESEEQVIIWIAAAIAYGPGVFCGMVIGYIFLSHNYEWFEEKFRRNKPRLCTISAR